MPNRTDLPEPPSSWRDRYRPFQSQGWTGWVDTDLADALSPWCDTPSRALGEDVVRWFKRGRNRLAEVALPYATAQNGAPRTLVVKEFGARDLWGRLRAAIRPGRAQRGWRAAFELLDRGFATPRPLWIALPRRPGPHAWLAVETAPRHVRLREALKRLRAGEVALAGRAQAPDVTGDDFLRAFAWWARALHDAGVWHRDFSGGNVLIPADWSPAAGSPEPFILLDVNRARFGSPGSLSITQRLHDLERVSLPEALRGLFYDAYSKGDVSLEGARERYLRRAASYRRLRETHRPIAKFWRKVFTYWLR